MIKIEHTPSTPYILADETRGYMYFRGESFHENVLDFYRGIVEWLQDFLNSDFETFTFDCELKYFNSSTAKMLLNILMMLDKAANKHKIIVNWITTADNQINIECGEDFSDEVTNATFHLVIQ